VKTKDDLFRHLQNNLRKTGLKSAPVVFISDYSPDVFTTNNQINTTGVLVNTVVWFFCSVQALITSALSMENFKKLS